MFKVLDWMMRLSKKLDAQLWKNLETMEKVLGGMNKVILDGVNNGQGGQGVVPFLPLNELGGMAKGAAATTGGSN